MASALEIHIGCRGGNGTDGGAFLHADIAVKWFAARAKLAANYRTKAFIDILRGAEPQCVKQERRRIRALQPTIDVCQ